MGLYSEATAVQEAALALEVVQAATVYRLRKFSHSAQPATESSLPKTEWCCTIAAFDDTRLSALHLRKVGGQAVVAMAAVAAVALD